MQRLEQHKIHQPVGESPLHAFDARVKLIATVLLIVGIVVTPDYAWIAYPLIWTLIGILAAIGQVSMWRLAHLSGVALPFTLAAITLLFITPGQPIMSVAGISVTDTGLARFIGIVLKSWLSMHIALLLSLTTPIDKLLTALHGIGISGTIVTIIGFMHRYLFTLRDEAERLLRARAARSGRIAGKHSGGTLLWRARTTGGMVSSLFLRSYERSERVYAAMLARGYDGRMHHQDLPTLTWQQIATGMIPVFIMFAIEIFIRL